MKISSIFGAHLSACTREYYILLHFGIVIGQIVSFEFTPEI